MPSPVGRTQENVDVPSYRNSLSMDVTFFKEPFQLEAPVIRIFTHEVQSPPGTASIEHSLIWIFPPSHVTRNSRIR